MKDWITKNWWSLMIATLSISSTYTMYGYRIEQLEKEVVTSNSQIIELQKSNNDANVNLAKIQKDIEYIRLQVDRIVK